MAKIRSNVRKGSGRSAKQDSTHITVILDRTGSMESIRDDTIGGFNTFLARQKTAPEPVTLTLVQFDSQDPYEIIHRFKPVKEVPELTQDTYVPRASTPLLDALGRGINDLEKGIGKLKKDSRPSKVVFVVVTDGQENASREFRKDQIKKMIKEKTGQYGWQFVFLSADLDAIQEAMSVGIADQSMIMFSKNKKGTARVWECLSQKTADFISSNSMIIFDDNDREHPDDPFKKQ